MNTPTVTAVPGKPNLLLGTYDVADLGYVAEEFFVSGTADAYAAVGELGPDGRWSAARSARADYTTRIVVLRPSDAAAFNGTLLVEWLNVSGGIDAPALWFMAHREMIREGYAYVAVSAQRVGVEGGASLGFDMSLKTQDPARYSSLRHPGDGFSYDIFSRVGRLARDGERTGALGLPHPENVVALGESQSALFMTTYVNAVDPLAKVYDGFLVHSRFAPAAPLDGASIFEASGAPLPAAVRFRPDLRVPVLTVITETDLVGGPGAGYHLARQPERRPVADLGDCGHRSRRQLHDSSRPDRHRIGVAGRPRGGVCAHQDSDGAGVGACHQLRPTAPLRAAGGAGHSALVGTYRRAGAARPAHRIERRRPTSAGPGRTRTRRGRYPDAVDRRADGTDIRPRH